MVGSAILQGHLWGGAAHDWADLQEPTSVPLWQAMLAAADVGPGTRLLDAGCGAGGASLFAAQRGAFVNGLDAAEALLDIARQRVPDGDFRMGDVELLPYTSSAFDAIIAADILPYTAQPMVALRELARVSRRGARMVVAIYGNPKECAVHTILRAARALLPACLGEQPFALSEMGVLESLLAGAGLRVLDGDEVSCPSVYPDRETAWQAQASAGPLQAAQRLVGTGPVRAVVLEALAPYTTVGGAIRLVNRFRYVTALPASGPWPGRPAGRPLRKGGEAV